MEYVIWGIPPNSDDEVPLYTKATSEAEAKRVMGILSDRHGCRAMRIQTLDLGLNDVQQMFRRAVKC